jgi:hypothetical protein
VPFEVKRHLFGEHATPRLLTKNQKNFILFSFSSYDFQHVLARYHYFILFFKRYPLGITQKKFEK